MAVDAASKLLLVTAMLAAWLMQASAAFSTLPASCFWQARQLAGPAVSGCLLKADENSFPAILLPLKDAVFLNIFFCWILLLKNFFVILLKIKYESNYIILHV